MPNVKTKTFSSIFSLILRQAKEQAVKRNIKKHLNVKKYNFKVKAITKIRVLNVFNL